MAGQILSYQCRAESGIVLLFYILISTAISTDPQNVHRNLESRQQMRSPILSSSLSVHAKDPPLLADGFRRDSGRLRGGCADTDKRPSCLPVMNSLLSTVNARALTCAETLSQLGAAAVSWFSALKKMRKFSSLQVHLNQPVPTVMDPLLTRQEDSTAAEGQSLGSGGSDPPSAALAAYDVMLSCLPRGVAARRVQVHCQLNTASVLQSIRVPR